MTLLPEGPPAEGWAAVYRLYDKEGVLIYIGSTGDPMQRWVSHRRSSPWWPEVASFTLEWHPSRFDAYREEAEAISLAQPKCNQVGTVAYGRVLSAKQQARSEDAKLKGRVSYEARALGRRIRQELIEQGAEEREATRIGCRAERDFKVKSGVFPKGVRHPPLSQCAPPEAE